MTPSKPSLPLLTHPKPICPSWPVLTLPNAYRRLHTSNDPSPKPSELTNALQDPTNPSLPLVFPSDPNQPNVTSSYRSCPVLISSTHYDAHLSTSSLGLGVVPGEWSFFHRNEWNYQEQSHHSEKNNEQIEHVLKTTIKRTNVEQREIAWKEW